MRRSKLLNGEISKLLSDLGHTQCVVLADAGLPVPAGVRLIDLSVARGLPSFVDVLNVIAAGKKLFIDRQGNPLSRTLATASLRFSWFSASNCATGNST